jgi:predicted phage terminase large subunit-like protein
LEHNKKQYRHICLPAELTKDVSPEFVKYYVDGLFFPVFFSRERLAEVLLEKTPQGYASMMLQAPTAVEGTTLLRAWFNNRIKKSEYELLCKTDRTDKNLMFIDTAYGTGGDRSAMLICQLIQGKIYIVEVIAADLEFYKLIQEILEQQKVYNIKKIYIETKATGISILQELRRLLRGNISVLGLDAGSKSKMERAQSIQPFLESGKVVLVEGGNWQNAFLDEIANFPYGKYDDRVDVLVYAVIQLLSRTYHPLSDDGTGTKESSLEGFYDDLYK